MCDSELIHMSKFVIIVLKQEESYDRQDKSRERAI